VLLPSVFLVATPLLFAITMLSLFRGKNESSMDDTLIVPDDDVKPSNDEMVLIDESCCCCFVIRMGVIVLIAIVSSKVNNVYTHNNKLWLLCSGAIGLLVFDGYEAIWIG